MDSQAIAISWQRFAEFPLKSVDIYIYIHLKSNPRVAFCKIPVKMESFVKKTFFQVTIDLYALMLGSVLGHFSGVFRYTVLLWWR